MNGISELDKARKAYTPALPDALKGPVCNLVAEEDGAAADYPDLVKQLFPNSLNKPLIRIDKGDGEMDAEPIKVGVVFSGGQAPGGHNVIAGTLDALESAGPGSTLIGFLGGPKGVIKNRSNVLGRDVVDQYRNTGGFDLLGSGRDKIEKPEDLEACRKSLESQGICGLVIIGGDDSNTNAALLAEYFLANQCDIRVIGVPKTIDGDMKNRHIEASFGFDTASKVYSELVGSICRDAMSAKKYWHFIRLMGRAASHITLEVALQTQPNMAIISEEARAEQWTLRDVVSKIVSVVRKRAEAGKPYGVLLIPEGLLEFLTDVNGMIAELGRILGTEGEYVENLPDHSERVQFLNKRFSARCAQVYNSLPRGIQEALLRRDKHDNIPLSQVETELLLIDLVSDEIRHLAEKDEFPGEFSPLGHFFGYEGRCVQPSNFDADYCYALGYTAVQLVRGGLTGYTVSARNLGRSRDEWIMGGIPVTSMLTVEERKGKATTVIQKTLVDLEGRAFRAFEESRDDWAVEDRYAFPGPIQYFGPPEVSDALTRTLMLEW